MPSAERMILATAQARQWAADNARVTPEHYSWWTAKLRMLEQGYREAREEAVRS